jgi:hypothetical protein
MQIGAIVQALISKSECPTASCDPRDMVIPVPASVELFETGFSTQEGPVDIEVDERWTDLGDEGYSLYCHQEGFRLSARTQRGVFYGQQTLDQIQRIGLIPNCKITDVPVMPMRGIMLDLARCKEKHEYYYHAVDQLAKWKINTVFLHLTDHSGCALQFDSYPTLATRYAFSKDEMRDLIRFAKDRYVDLIPEIEAWGHARYITTKPEFADLAEDPADPRALCTSNPKVWQMLERLFAETAELFPSQYIHAGCDEAAFGKCQVCAEKAERLGMDALVGEHLKRVSELVSATGKTPMIWGDVLLNYRGSADLVPRNTVITHWDYRADLSIEPFEFLRDKGFSVLGCPAIVQGSRMILPMPDTLDNTANCASHVIETECLGMDTTVWVPQRYLSDTLWFSLAYASELSWSGHRRDRLAFATAFAEHFYGLEPSESNGQVLIDAHELSTKSYDWVQNPWNYAAQIISHPDTDPPANADTINRLIGLREKLLAIRAEVTRHEEEFDALLLAADVGIGVRQRAVAIRDLIKRLSAVADLAHTDQERAASKIEEEARSVGQMMDSDAILRDRLDSAWDRWRYPDDPIKREGGENLMEGFENWRKFLNTLASRLSDVQSRMIAGQDVDWEALWRPEEAYEERFIDAGDVAHGVEQ